MCLTHHTYTDTPTDRNTERPRHSCSHIHTHIHTQLSKENVQVPCDEPLSPCGSILYMAPEMLEMTGGTSVDWWTLGILMHEMLTGNSPWKSETQNAVLAELRGSGKVKLSPELSPRAASLISALLIRQPRKRLGTKGAMELQQHSFFWPRLKQTSDWKKLYAKKMKPPIRPCRAKKGDKKLGDKKDPAESGSDNSEQIQYGKQNFEKSQRTLAIKVGCRVTLLCRVTVNLHTPHRKDKHVETLPWK